MSKFLLTAFSPSVYGAGRMASEFVRELDRQGHEVHFAYEQAIAADVPSISSELESEGIPVHHFPKMSSELMPLGNRGLTRLFRKHAFDCVFSSQVRDAAPVMAAANRANIRSVAICMNQPNFNGNQIAKFTKFKIYQRALKQHADHVIVVAPDIKGKLSDNFGVAESNISVVLCGLDPQSIEPTPPESINELRREFQIKPDDFVAVNLARIHRQKGQDVLLEAFAILNRTSRLPENFRMLMVGGCENLASEEMLNGFKRFVRQEGLEKHVEFVGFRSDYRDFLHLADLFVLPSRWEGLPLVVLEAFAARVPVLMTEYGRRFEGFRDRIDGVYVPNEDSGALANALIELSEMPSEHLKAIGSNGAGYFERNLSLEQTLRSFNAVIDKILSDR